MINGVTFTLAYFLAKILSWSLLTLSYISNRDFILNELYITIIPLRLFHIEDRVDRVTNVFML